jgi:hypothetical protein
VLSQNKLCSQKKVSIVTAIAVVGIGCRLPGYVDSPDALWGALLAGIDFVTDIPQQRWNADDYYEPVAGAPHKAALSHAGARSLTTHRASTIAFSASANLIALEADTGIRRRAVDVTTVRAMADALSGAMQESQPAGADGRD